MKNHPVACALMFVSLFGVACGRTRSPSIDGLDVLYDVRSALSRGMSTQEVEAVLVAPRAKPLQRRNMFEGNELRAITLITPFTGIDVCQLLLELHGGVLAHAAIHGEDGPEDKCPGAPPDF